MKIDHLQCYTIWETRNALLHTSYLSCDSSLSKLCGLQQFEHSYLGLPDQNLVDVELAVQQLLFLQACRKKRAIAVL